MNGLSLGHASQLVAPEDPPLGVGAYVPALQSLHVSPSMRYWPAPHWRQFWRTDPPPLSVNMSSVFETSEIPEISQQSTWLNADAPRNILFIVVTLLVSQLPMF